MKYAATAIVLLLSASVAGCAYFSVDGSGLAFKVAVDRPPPVTSDGGAEP